MSNSKTTWLMFGLFAFGLTAFGFIYLVRQSLVRRGAIDVVRENASPTSARSKKPTTVPSVEHYLSLPEEEDDYGIYTKTYDESLSIESFYDYLARHKPELKQFEHQVAVFNHNQDSVFQPFNEVKQKCDNYYQSILNIVEPKNDMEPQLKNNHSQVKPVSDESDPIKPKIAFKHSELKKQVRILIQNSQKQSQTRQIEWTQLIDALDKRETQWNDYYLLFKVNQTLPFIEQYHQEQIKQLKGFQAAQALKLHQDTLFKNVDRLMKK